jgi:hypothetical protein
VRGTFAIIVPSRPYWRGWRIPSKATIDNRALVNAEGQHWSRPIGRGPESVIESLRGSSHFILINKFFRPEIERSLRDFS